MKMFKVGDKVLVDHGTGVVIGFERFLKGFSAPMGDVQLGDERIFIKLDTGHTWQHNGVAFGEVYASFNHETKLIEFSRGDKVHFQAYTGNNPFLREVLKVTDLNFFGQVDGNIYYHLGHYNSKGQDVVTSQTTGRSIKQSTLFNLEA